MCGIAGVIQIGGAPREVCSTPRLTGMLDAIVHRGPDDHGIVQRPGAGFGARRLSIIDVDGGHQPFANEDSRIWGAQNGEIYNHAMLRESLQSKGHQFRSRCDTEVLPHLYEEYGDAFVEKLRGMFAVVVWDDTQKKAILARDRLGIKPLYYAHVGDLVVFGSELKSLLVSGLVETTLDYGAIDAYMELGFFPTPMTPLAQVRKLRPGHRLIIDSHGVREEQYWSYPLPSQAKADKPVEHYAEALLEQLEDSVRMRLMSDVPLGAMLSGGLDSSLIVGLMARNMSDPVKTFSVGFEGTGKQNELADAKFVANHFGAEHHAIELPLDADADLAELVWHLDEPLADLSSLGFLGLSQLARKHVTVALSGQGADELLGGYRKHRAASVAGSWHKRLGGSLASGLAQPLCFAPGRFGRMGRTLAASNPVDRLLASSGNLSSAQRRRLLNGDLAAVGGGMARSASLGILGDAKLDPLGGALYLDGQLGLVDDMLQYFDRASMAHSLEVRVPFLDHEFVEFAAGIPLEYKVGPGLDTKHVLKRAARGLVPDRIIDKPKIGFFNKAVDGWINAQLNGAIHDYLGGSNPITADLFDQRELKKMLAAQGKGGGDGAYVLLEVLMLEVWLQSFVPRATQFEGQAR